MVKEAQEELAYKAIAWCEARNMVTSPNNIVCALDNLGLLKETQGEGKRVVVIEPRDDVEKDMLENGELLDVLRRRMDQEEE